MSAEKATPELYIAKLEQQVRELEKERVALQAQLIADRTTADFACTYPVLFEYLSDRLQRSVDINTVLQTVVTELGKAIQADYCLLIEFDLEKQLDNEAIDPNFPLSASTHVRYSYSAPNFPAYNVPTADMVRVPEVAQAFATGQPLAIYDTVATYGDRYRLTYDLNPLIPPSRAFLGVPIFFGGQAIAFLKLSFVTGPHTWTAQETALAETVAARLGGAVSHSRLFAQVHTEQRRTMAVISKISEGVVAVDYRGRIVLVNSSLLKMIGGSEADWQGHSVREKLPFMLTEVPHKTILYHCNVDGRAFQVITSPLSDERWADAGIASVSILHDVTEEVRMSRAKDNFLTLISHELRTPLTSISGALDILNEEELGQFAPLQKEFLLVAVKNTNRLIRLLETTFDITRLETGHLRLDQGPVLLEEVMQRVLDSNLLESYRHKRLTFRIDFSQAPRVYGDPGRLIQIFENLISNACKFTPIDGLVEIESFPAEKGQVQISVTDTGIGLSIQDQHHLFEKFFRVDHSLTRETGGSGLGLAITRSLVELHGSQLQVESAPGKGSRFSFKLPNS